MGTIISHYMDRYEPTSIMESNKVSLRGLCGFEDDWNSYPEHCGKMIQFEDTTKDILIFGSLSATCCLTCVSPVL